MPCSWKNPAMLAGSSGNCARTLRRITRVFFARLTISAPLVTNARDGESLTPHFVVREPTLFRVLLCEEKVRDEIRHVRDWRVLGQRTVIDGPHVDARGIHEHMLRDLRDCALTHFYSSHHSPSFRKPPINHWWRLRTHGARGIPSLAFGHTYTRRAFIAMHRHANAPMHDNEKLRVGKGIKPLP